MAANQVARAQLDLVRIRAVRTELMAQLDLASGDTEFLRRLAALNRYERLAHTRRGRARGNFSPSDDRFRSSDRLIT
jgi:hypothetical protein